MKGVQIFNIVKLVIRGLSAYGMCTRAKQAQGEVIDWSDRLECVFNALSALEKDIVPLIDTTMYKERK